MSRSESETSFCFIDTNIWLYAFIEVQGNQKSTIAKDLIRENEPVVSTQVINEVCVNLIRKAQFPEESVRQLITSFYFIPLISFDQTFLSKRKVWLQ